MTSPSPASPLWRRPRTAGLALAILVAGSISPAPAWSQTSDDADGNGGGDSIFDPVEYYGEGYRLVKGIGYRDADDRVPVAIGIRLITLSDIDSQEETFTVEAILYVTWSADWGEEEEGWTEESVDQKLKTVKDRPVPEFENGLGTRKRYSLLMGYDPVAKLVEYEERFSMAFSTEMELKKFPFDEQELKIKILVGGGQEDVVDMRIDEYTHAIIDEAEWFTNDNSYAAEVEHNVIPYDVSGPDADPDNVFPRSVFKIKIKRRSGFYMWRVLLPLFLITMVSWAMFWMSREDLGDRLGVSFTALLTIVAYNLILGDILPRIAYLTFLDELITLTYLWLSAGVLESVFVAGLKNQVLADRVDNISKVLFPATYLAGVTLTAFVFL